jgi:hypothetical protein
VLIDQEAARAWQSQITNQKKPKGLFNSPFFEDINGY